GVPRHARREPADGPPPAPGHLSPGVPARLGEQNLLYPAPPRPAAPSAGPRSPRCPPGRRGRAPATQAGDDRADARQSLLFGGGCADPDRAGGYRRRTRALAPGPPAPDAARPRHGAGCPGSTPRPAATGGEAPRADRRRHRYGGAWRPAAGPRGAVRGG